MQPITHFGYFQEGSVALAWKDEEICSTSNPSTPQRKGVHGSLAFPPFSDRFPPKCSNLENNSSGGFWLPFELGNVCVG